MFSTHGSVIITDRLQTAAYFAVRYFFDRSKQSWKIVVELEKCSTTKAVCLIKLWLLLNRRYEYVCVSKEVSCTANGMLFGKSLVHIKNVHICYYI